MRAGLAKKPYSGRRDNRRLQLALVLALITHAIIILGIQMSDSTPVASSKNPVWSFHVSLLKPPGGTLGSSSMGATSAPQPPEPAPPPTVRASEVQAPEDVPELVTTVTEATSLPQPEDEPPARETTAASPPTLSPQAEPLKLSVADLMQQGLQQARIAADQDKAGNTRRKYADLYRTTTPDGAYAAYWVRKVEGVGELNLSQALRQNRTTGPVLDVAIRADGSLQHVQIIQPSGNERLDATIRRIVTEAAPYAPFPDALERECDVLHIKHRWIFR